MARRRQAWLASLLCVAGLLGPSQPDAVGVSPDKPDAASTITPWKGPAPHVIIETDRGKLTLELYPEVAPRTVARFAELVKRGFYNGLTFHRVVPKFLIQGGDPAGDGTGGSGLPIPAEFSEKKHGTGTVGMARRRDPDSADSQFYICLEPQPFLDGKYTVFGQVVDGLDVLPKIQEHDVIRMVTLQP
jgi:cyclophilin family peptidyl-prolyl cis-trans isomerase